MVDLDTNILIITWKVSGLSSLIKRQSLRMWSDIYMIIYVIYIYITSHRNRQQCGDSQRKGGGGRWRWAKWENVDGKRLFLGRWTHDVVCRWCFIELYTWNLYGFVKQYHPNNLFKRQSLSKWIFKRPIYMYILSTRDTL